MRPSGLRQGRFPAGLRRLRRLHPDGALRVAVATAGPRARPSLPRHVLTAQPNAPRTRIPVDPGSALLLRLAGASHEAIGEDYAVSEVNLAARRPGEWIDSAPDEREREKRIRLSTTPAAAMVRVVEEIERRYGDVPAYLCGAGLTDEQIDRLRGRLAP
ncbi:MAG: tyrosine-protein phosphatase [Gaiellaceae bacterium]